MDPSNPKWAEMEEKYKQDIEILTESVEMVTIEKEIAEEKLDRSEKELQDVRNQLAQANQQLDQLRQQQQTEQPVTVLQLHKLEEQNEILKQALIKVRDISAKDKKELEDLLIEREELQVKLLDAEEKEHSYKEKIQVLEEQVDVSQNAQEMVEKLSRQKGELEDKLKEMIEDMDSMEKLRDLNEQLLESARENEIDLTSQLDRLQVRCIELQKRKRDMEEYLTDQERTVIKLRDENRVMSEQIVRLKGHFKENELIEQKHQIENVAFKLNFSESKMLEKDAEIARYKRNLAELEDQMNNMSLITKEQSARLDDLKMQHDIKVNENSELQRALKKKMEEVSELEIRRDMAEKRLQSVQKDKEAKVAELTRKLETMKGLEIRHEEDMKRLMEDNELIERERRELRDQLNRSNRSLERSIQTAGNLSMVTAHDTSLASLGISFQTSPSVQSSPIAKRHQQPAIGGPQSTVIGPITIPVSSSAQQAQQGDQQLVQTQGQILTLPSAVSSGGPMSPLSSCNIVPMAASPSLPATRRQLFSGNDRAIMADNEFLFGKFRELSIAFDRATRKNHELELELAYREIENKPPPYDGCRADGPNRSGFDTNLASVYDIDRAKKVGLEMKKLKREIRAAIINQQICTKSRNIAAHLREERFNISKLAMRYQALEFEASNLLSSSSLSWKTFTPSSSSTLAMSGTSPMLQSTPVK